MDTVVPPFVDGVEAPSGEEAQFEICNPATGEKSIAVPYGCDADVEKAVSSARAAFEDGRWCDLASSARSVILHKFADLIESNSAKLDRLDALDMGKPIGLRFGNASSSAGIVRYCADTVGNLLGELYSSDPSTSIFQRGVPRGVVAAITPWNFPTIIAVGKLAPALAAGNSVVLKPSECSPRSAVRLAQLAVEAGVPPGVFNLVQGLGETVGRALALHHDVDMLAFTGSTAVGKLMLQYSGQSNLKLVQAECGGKSPQIVFADYEDLDTVAETVAQSILTNQGQLCVAGSRLLVQKEIEPQLIEKIIRYFQSVVAGSPTDKTTTYGPLVNRNQLERVLHYVDAGSRDGHRVYGGNPILLETGGYFVEPTLFSGIPQDSKVFQEEIFGPVLTVTSFNDLEEAIRLANSTKYGLAAYAWTNNHAYAMKLSKEVRTGILTINSSAPSGEGSMSLSIEPYGMSGVGVEHGLAGLESYLRRQVSWFNHAGAQ